MLDKNKMRYALLVNLSLRLLDLTRRKEPDVDLLREIAVMIVETLDEMDLYDDS